MTSNIKEDALIGFTTSSNNTQVQQQEKEISSLILNHQYFPASNSEPSTALATAYTSNTNTQEQQLLKQAKKKRNLPGTPDPTAEVIALSPKSLLATNRFVCEICNKGFKRDQNLQLHRRGHNLPWKLKQRVNTETIRKKVYICPEASCVHHHPCRALGDLTGIKKHYSRKHGEKKWKCDKCSKKYAVRSDLKAHAKICGTREYKCDCGTIFSRRDSFITHRAFCDALAHENNIFGPAFMSNFGANLQGQLSQLISSVQMHNDRAHLSSPQELMHMHPKSLNMPRNMFYKGCSSLTSQLKSENYSSSQLTSFQENSSLSLISTTAMLQEAAQISATANMNDSIRIDQESAFEGIQFQQSNAFDHGHFMGVSSTEFTGNMRKGAREISSQLFANDRLGMFTSNFNNQNDHANLKSLEENEAANLHGIGRVQLGNNNSGSGNGDNDSTVDFLGIGGMTRGYFQRLQKQEMEFENIWPG